jgi:hypothetical protein
MQVMRQIVVARIVETGKFFCPKCAVYADHQRVEFRKWQTAWGVKLYPIAKPWQLVKCAACYSEGKPHIPLDPRYWDAQKRQLFTKHVLQALVGIAREGGRVLHPSAWSYIREAYVHACGELPNEIDLGNLIRYRGRPRSIDNLNLDRKTLKRVENAKEMLRHQFKTKARLGAVEFDPTTHPAAIAQRKQRASAEAQARAYQAYLNLRGVTIFDDLPAAEHDKIMAALQLMNAQFKAACEKHGLPLARIALPSAELSWKTDLLRRHYPEKFLTLDQWKQAGEPKQ